jgi:MFS family permease
MSGVLPIAVDGRKNGSAMSFGSAHALAARPPDGHRSIGFLLIFAIAIAGGVMGYLPLLTLLLPMKIEALAGDGRLGLLSATVVSGAIAASLSNILFGWASDRSVAAGRGRRRWVGGGLVATALSYALIDAASTPGAIVLATIIYQTALNALLGPLWAIMADEVPDAQKGFTGGLLALANPAASAVLAIVVSIGSLDETGQLAIVVAAIALCVTPLLLVRARPIPIVVEPREVAIVRRRDLAIAWGARLLIQVAGAVLSLYLLYYFESVTPNESPRDLAPHVGHLLTISFVLPLPIAVLVGRLSDRLDRRKPFLLTAAAVAAIGLLGMALAHGWAMGAVAFGLYAIGSGVFLPLLSAFTMQLLPDPRHRGRDLGLINLTNTLPQFLGPLLTWTLATPRDFSTLMLALAVLALCGGLAILGVRGRR